HEQTASIVAADALSLLMARSVLAQKDDASITNESRSAPAPLKGSSLFDWNIAKTTTAQLITSETPTTAPRALRIELRKPALRAVTPIAIAMQISGKTSKTPTQ